MSKKLSQAEIDALISGMLSGDVDPSALAELEAEAEAAPAADAAGGGSAADAAAADVGAAGAAAAEAAVVEAAAVPVAGDLAVPAADAPAADAGAADLIDLGPITQDEVNTILLQAGKGALIPPADPVPAVGMDLPAAASPEPLTAAGAAEITAAGLEPISEAEIAALIAATAAAGPAPEASLPGPAAVLPEHVPTPTIAAMAAPTSAPAPVAAAAPQPRVLLPVGPAAQILMDLELTLTAELVRTRMRMGQLLGLQPGSVLELDRLANEPVDVIINGHPMMKAKVVTMGENYGIQVTETRLGQKAAS